MADVVVELGQQIDSDGNSCAEVNLWSTWKSVAVELAVVVLDDFDDSRMTWKNPEQR